MRFLLPAVILALTPLLSFAQADPIQLSGIYPHLAMFNDEHECGTGAVVPWADRLWIITYGPHMPFGSSDKLYEISPSLEQTVRPESLGGTPANRLIHRESKQLFIGPYAIDADRHVRVIPWSLMPGRLTGSARHLTDPANKIYTATMEEGLYEIDVKSLEVTGLIIDGNKPKPGQTAEKTPASVKSELPGYHGKGLYSTQGKLVYANNGERDERIATDPTIPSGALAEWSTPGEDWKLVRRNQFTEVTGPGGIEGNAAETDPLWSIGWDYRSLILMCLDKGKWTSYRLPKGSHSYDGSHGWNTEWPRIRDIGEDSLLMTMHGTFWRFPKTFTPATSAGITPRSNYLKVIGDFARWQDRIVFGCDDTAASEFLNTRKAKGHVVPPGQSQSNLWFVKPEQLDHFGPLIGRGAVWQNDEVKANTPSEPYLFSGYQTRTLHLSHSADSAVTFTLEVDTKGDGNWQVLTTLEVPAKGYLWHEFTKDQSGTWIRLTTNRDVPKATAFFHYFNPDTRSPEPTSITAGLTKVSDAESDGGLLHVRGENNRTLRLVTQQPGSASALYDLDVSLELKPVTDTAGLKWTQEKVAIPQGVITIDEASVLYVDDRNRRWRFPKSDVSFDQAGPLGMERLCREVCTERDLINVQGTFYELPAENAGGFARMRPVATHNLHIKDFATYRGLLFLSGVSLESADGNAHIIRSADGDTALWAGAVDDLWQFGKPRGQGGPWKDSAVKAGVPSDPYLMTAYDKKSLTLSHSGSTRKEPVKFKLEVDFTGDGGWVPYQEFEVLPGQSVEYKFPDAFTAYWVRLVTDKDTTATALFKYE